MGEKVEMQKFVLNMFDHVYEPIAERMADPAVYAFPEDMISTRTLEKTKTTWQKYMDKLEGVPTLAKGRVFSAFDPTHMKEAMTIVRLLLKLKGSELKDILTYVRDQVNEQLYIYATSMVSLNHPDMRHVVLPPIQEVLPTRFVPVELVKEAIKKSNERPADNAMEPIVIPHNQTGDDRDPEHRMAYWREDVALNSHHWHWHLVYPLSWTPDLGGMKDRKGELCYYMHQQLEARYDTERLCNNLNRNVPFKSWKDPIPEAYFPHLATDLTDKVYASRPVNMVPSDLPTVSLHNQDILYSRIMDAIDQGSVVMPDGSRLKLEEETGTDILGAIVEATELSKNKEYYGDYHNNGHLIFTRIHDPDGRFNMESGVIADNATACRDPFFWRWHRFVDDIFQRYKRKLPPHTKEALTWNDVTVDSVVVQGNISQRPNYLQTYWQNLQVTLNRGINFTRPTPIAISVRHLQHEQFSYKIEITNKTKSNKDGTVRIFLAPKLNEKGEPFELNDQRAFYMEQDKFAVNLKPGKNAIKREAKDSNVTIPTLRSYGQLIELVDKNEELETYCSCGLPDHLLLPRGKPEGMAFQLFVMVTNAIEDKVDGPKTNRKCTDAASYCGILDEKYPDKKPMGFPFDRPFPAPKETTPADPKKPKETLTLGSIKTPSMAFTELTIRFRHDVTVEASGGSIMFPEN